MNVKAVIPRLKILFGVSKSEIIVEDGDTPEEVAALKDLDKFNRSTGPLSGSSVVRLVEEEDPYILAWIDPHCKDPVAVRLYNKEGGFEWMFVDDPDKDHGAWSNSSVSPRSLVAKMIKVLEPHSDAIFATIESAQKPEIPADNQDDMRNDSVA